jgi:hypothetical protein
MFLAAIALLLAIVLVVLVFMRSRGHAAVARPNEDLVRPSVVQADAPPRPVAGPASAPPAPMKRGGGLRVPTGEREAPITRAHDNRDQRGPDDVSLRRRTTPPRTDRS